MLIIFGEQSESTVGSKTGVYVNRTNSVVHVVLLLVCLLPQSTVGELDGDNLLVVSPVSTDMSVRKSMLPIMKKTIL